MKRVMVFLLIWLFLVLPVFATNEDTSDFIILSTSDGWTEECNTVDHKCSNDYRKCICRDKSGTCLDYPGDLICARDYYCREDSDSVGCTQKKDDGNTCSLPLNGADCVSGRCYDSLYGVSVCAPKLSDGEECELNNDCQSNRCSDTINGKRCEGIDYWIGDCGIGGGCSEDHSACTLEFRRERNCGDGYYCKQTRTSSSCIPKKNIGESCDGNYECRDGFCDGGRVCSPGLPEGSECSSNVECYWDLCVDNLCIGLNNWIGTCPPPTICLDNHQSCGLVVSEMPSSILDELGLDESDLESLIEETGDVLQMYNCTGGYSCGAIMVDGIEFDSCIPESGAECNRDLDCEAGRECFGGLCIEMTTFRIEESCEVSADCSGIAYCSGSFCVDTITCSSSEECTISGESCVTNGHRNAMCRPINITDDIDGDGILDGEDLCVGNSDPEGDCDSIETGLSCSAISGVVCENSCGIGSNWSDGISTELNCCVSESGRPTCEADLTYVVELGINVRFNKECGEDGRTIVQIVNENDHEITDATTLNLLGVNSNPYVDSTDHSCSGINLDSDPGEEVPSYGFISLILSLSLIFIFYFFRRKN